MRTVEGFVVAPGMEDRRLKAFLAQEFQTTIVGMMGHDLRQSLQVIQGTYSLLRSRLEEMPQQAWVDRGERAVTKLTEQLNCLGGCLFIWRNAPTRRTSPSVGLGPLFWRLRHEKMKTPPFKEASISERFRPIHMSSAIPCCSVASSATC